MKTNRTEPVFILDRCGSMSGLEGDTTGGYNAMLEKQKKKAGEATVTTVLFDDRYELLHDRIDLRGPSPSLTGSITSGVAQPCWMLSARPYRRSPASSATPSRSSGRTRCSL